MQLQLVLLRGPTCLSCRGSFVALFHLVWNSLEVRFFTLEFRFMPHFVANDQNGPCKLAVSEEINFTS